VSSEATRKRCEKFVVKSVNVFDPDIAYLYADAMAEFDYLVVEGSSAYIVESVSSREECITKHVRNQFLSLSLPPIYWSSETGKPICDEQGFLSNPPISVNELEQLAEACKHVWEPVYRDATEIANFILYTRLFMPRRFREQIYKDFEKLGELGTSSSGGDILRRIAAFAKATIMGGVPAENATSTGEAGECYYGELAGELSRIKTFILMIQFGITYHSLRGLVDQLRKFVVEKPGLWRDKLDSLKLVIALNEELIRQYSSEIERVAESLRLKLAPAQTLLCLLKGRELVCGDSLDQLEKHCKQESSLLEESGGDYLILVFQDWSKRYFEEWISYLLELGGNIYVAVVPETGYYYPGKLRLVESYYGFYSIEKCKAFLFKWAGGQGEVSRACSAIRSAST